MFDHDFEGGLGVHGRLVAALVGEGSEDVDDGGHAGQIVELGGNQALGVAGAVEFFVMLPGDGDDALGDVGGGVEIAD